MNLLVCGQPLRIGTKIAPKCKYIYSDKVVILVHIVTSLFRIGLRQTVGFIQGYLQQIGKKLTVISYSQASRRFKKLNIKINDCRVDKNNMEGIEIAIDSTSISITLLVTAKKIVKIESIAVMNR